jgi:hypothetical protein
VQTGGFFKGTGSVEKVSAILAEKEQARIANSPTQSHFILYFRSANQ